MSASPNTETARERMRQAEADGVKQARERKANGAAGKPRLALRYLDEIRSRAADRYIVKGIFNAGEFSTITGAPGHGKTHVATDIGFHVALKSCDWRGHRIRQTGVLIVAAEGGSAIDDRLEALRRQFSPPANLPLAVISDSIDLCHSDDDAELLAARMGEAAIRFGMPVGLCQIDTLSRALAGGDENSPQDMGAFVRRVDILRETTGAHMTAVHHLGKDLARGARGHSLLRAAVDTEVIVTRDDVTRIITARVDKQRNGPSGAEIHLALEVVELGRDEDGDPLTACIVVDAEAPAKRPGPASAKLSAPCAIALTALRQAIADAGETPSASTHIPTGIKVVSTELWRRYAYAKNISDGEQNAKRMAFNRAADQLLARGLVGCWQDRVWPVSGGAE